MYAATVAIPLAPVGTCAIEYIENDQCIVILKNFLFDSTYTIIIA
jgi:hypothetical protein